MNIVVLGYIVRGPLGGLVWHHFQYVLGLHKLGHKVFFIEESDDYPSCYDPVSNTMTFDPTFGLSFISSLFSDFDLKDRWAFFDKHANNWYGLEESQIKKIGREADILINISGINDISDLFMQIPVRIFIDTDPLFVQVRNLQNEKFYALTSKHNVFLSYGENIFSPKCTIPNDGFNWLPTRQPIVLDIWNQHSSILNNNTKWTTVMQWKSYEPVQYSNIKYGMKSDSFQPYWTLPNESQEEFEIAIGGTAVPAEKFKEHGWNLISSLEVTQTPWTYKNYIYDSKGEWTVAKHGYVISNSGWFSERSAVYLACGKPVITQNTGFTHNINTGLGLFAFNSLEEALECIKRVNKDYLIHSKHAKITAQEYFDSKVILKKMIDIGS